MLPRIRILPRARRSRAAVADCAPADICCLPSRREYGLVPMPQHDDVAACLRGVQSVPRLLRALVRAVPRCMGGRPAIRHARRPVAVDQHWAHTPVGVLRVRHMRAAAVRHEQFRVHGDEALPRAQHPAHRTSTPLPGQMPGSHRALRPDRARGRDHDHVREGPQPALHHGRTCAVEEHRLHAPSAHLQEARRPFRPRDDRPLIQRTEK
jgi:hypothetical protein